MKKIVITGGHLTPAQAVIEELKIQGGWEIYYLGRKYCLEGKKIPSAESEIIPKLGVKFFPIPAGRLQRRFNFYTLWSLVKVPWGLLNSLFLLMKIKPDVILSFGGYVSVPVVVAGWLLKIPILTHEQTVVSGLANQINAFFAQKILVSFPESFKYFPKGKTVLTGNPIRKEVFNYQLSTTCLPARQVNYQLSNGNLPFVYITGGNQGAQTINQAVVEVLPEFLKNYRLVHQCGKLDYKKLSAISYQLSAKIKQRYFLTDYVGPKDIGWVLNQADLVVSRAGANIVSELAVLGKPAILIPIPWAAKNEQARNAQMLAKAGTAIVLSQKGLSGKKLLATINKMAANLEQYQAAASKAKKLVKPKAARTIVEQINEICEN